MRNLARSVAACGLSVASVLSLGGCFFLPSTPPSATESSSPPAESTTPTPVATVEAPSDVLFTVTATTTDSEGGPVQLTMTAHRPQPSTNPGRESIRDEYIDGCNALGGGSVSNVDIGLLDSGILAGYGSSLMVIDVESTPAGRTFANPISLSLGSPYYFQVTTGDNVSNLTESYCYPGSQLDGTGAVTDITNYETASATPDPTQWRYGRYGFTIEGGKKTLENCTFTSTPLAVADGMNDVDGWSATGATNKSCAIGYQGE
jgi:hypothetical protein